MLKLVFLTIMHILNQAKQIKAGKKQILLAGNPGHRFRPKRMKRKKQSGEKGLPIIFDKKQNKPKYQQRVEAMKQNTDKMVTQRFGSKQFMFNEIGKNMNRAIVAVIRLAKNETYAFACKLFYKWVFNDVFVIIPGGEFMS